MLQFTRFQTAMVLGLILIAGLFALPNFLSESQRAQLPGFMPKGTINLGLDLQGGSFLMLEVDTGKVLGDRLNNLAQDVRTTMRPDRSRDRARIGIQTVDIDRDARQVRIKVRDRADFEDAIARVRSLVRRSLLPGSGVGGNFGLGSPAYSVAGSDDLITITMVPEARAAYGAEAVRDSIEVVRRRLDPAGNKEVSIQPQGADRIVVQVPGNDDPEGLKEILNRTGQLSFHAVDQGIPAPTIADWADVPFDEDTRCREVAGMPPNRIVRENIDGEFATNMVLEERAVITGDMVDTASAGPNSEGGGFQINFGFDNRGARRFGDYTRENIGQLFAIVLDCKIISAPRIQSAIIGGSGRITGDFSAEEAVRISTLIRSGALPAPLQTIEQRTVSASLGEDSIKAGRLAIVVGFAAVIFYMFMSYGRFGLFANIALIANIILIAGALSLFGSTLTLPGIAGIVLTIGMAVDANVLIFERIREELKGGKSPIMAVETGFVRARSAIIDANITTFLAAFIMFFLGAGPVQGFAVTLAIGVVTSVFTAYVVTRLFAGGWLLRKRPKEIAL